MMKQCLGWLVVLLFVLTSTGGLADLQRVNVGVYGGQVRDIAAYNNGGQAELFAGVQCQRGVFHWNAASSIWETVTYPTFPGSADQVEVARHSGYENNVYALITPQQGPVKLCGSATGGVYGSWENLTNSGINSPSVLFGHSSGFYVGTRDGRIYRNTGGPSGSFIELYQHSTATEIMSISPYDGNCIYASVSPSPPATNIFRIQWNGATYVKTDVVAPTTTGSGSTDVRTRIVGVTPSDSNEIYVAGAASEVQIYHSTDGGLTWPDKWYNANMSGNFYGGYPAYIKFNNDRVFISHCTRTTLGVWTSVQNAATMIDGSYNVSTHPNDAALEVDPVYPTNVFFDTDWAIAAAGCTLAGEWGIGTEISTNKGIEGVVLNDMDFYEYSATNKTLWIAAKSGIGRTLHFDPTNLGTTADPVDWAFPLYPDGSPAYSIAINPTNPAVVLAGYNSGRLFRTDKGEETNANNITWSQVFFAGDHSNEFGTANNDVTISAVEFVPSRPDEVYLAGFRWQPPTTNGAVYYSADGGVTWTNDFTNAPVNALMIMDNAAWAGVGSAESAEKGIRAKVGLGTWWKPTSGMNFDNEIVAAMDGATYGSRMIVYVTTGMGMTTGGVYKGVNTNLSAGGFTNWVWTDVTAGISITQPASFSAVALDPTNPDRAFVACQNCIYETIDGGTTWSTLSGSCVDSHENVRVLVYDDLMGGTGDGLYSYVYYGPYLQVSWSSETGRVYRLKASSTVTGTYSTVTWNSMLSTSTQKVANVSQPPSGSPMFYRVEGEDSSTSVIQSIQYLNSSP